jgi:sugar O-acyltransferase (sialic acid O-acetyltransferase NeuD family)
MARSFVIWGSSGHALVLADILAFDGAGVSAFFDNNTEAKSPLPGINVFHGADGFEKWKSNTPNLKSYSAAIAIGGDRGNIRREIAQRFIELNLEVPSLLHPRASLSPSATIGVGCHILAGATISAGVVISDHVIVNTNSSVDHECQLAEGVHIAPGATLCGCISVGENSMIGAGACVLPRVSIGANSVVGAGAVVTHDIPANTVYVGNPARFLKHRETGK